MKLRGDLVEAYLGYYEEEWHREYDGFMSKTGAIIADYEGWSQTRCRQEILEDTPAKRLEIYLEWNGIIGYTNPIIEILHGKLWV